MENLELDSFINKFKVLWNSGLDAHLELNTHAGQAWVNLRVRLGHAPGPSYQFPPPEKRSRNGPARQRRREKRAAERAATAEKVEHGAEEATNHNAEKATSYAADASVEIIPNDDDVTEEVMDVVNDIESENIGSDQMIDRNVEHDDPAYCYICKNSEQLASEEDLSYHMMNDHDAKEVLAIYGEAWIENRRYCIRRGSPFLKWFSTPPI